MSETTGAHTLVETIGGDKYDELVAALDKLTFLELAITGLDGVLSTSAHDGLVYIMRDAHDTIRHALEIPACYD